MSGTRAGTLAHALGHAAAGARRCRPAADAASARTRQQFVHEAAHACGLPERIEPLAQRAGREEVLVLPQTGHNVLLVLRQGGRPGPGQGEIASQAGGRVSSRAGPADRAGGDWIRKAGAPAAW